MGTYIGRRLLSLILTLVLVAIVSFLLIYLVPGDPAAVMIGPEARPDQIEALRRQLGLDKPLFIQFLLWAGRALQGDLGRSYFLGRDVSAAIFERLPCTLSLAILALLFAVAIAIPAGVLSAIKQNSLIDKAMMLFALIGVSLPSFWIGLNLILLFAVILQWFPSGGYVPLTESFRGGLKCLFLPALSLGFMQVALIARMTRSCMLDVLRQDYIRTAKAKGLAERIVIWKHALKNGMIPVLTVIGLGFGVLLGGAVIVESVFALPGIGRLIVLGVQRRDYPLVQGSILYVTLIYVLVNLAVDILYSFFDPRIRY